MRYCTDTRWSVWLYFRSMLDCIETAPCRDAWSFATPWLRMQRQISDIQRLYVVIPEDENIK